MKGVKSMWTIRATLNWASAHKYEIKIINDHHIFYRTNYQTCEVLNGETFWHEWEYFDLI